MAVRHLTETMFPVTMSVEIEADPAFPQERFVVFSVRASGSLEEIVQIQSRWHQEVVKLAPERLNTFRISVAPA